MKDSFKNYNFLAQNFNNQALKLHLQQLQNFVGLKIHSIIFFSPRFSLEKRIYL